MLLLSHQVTFAVVFDFGWHEACFRGNDCKNDETSCAKRLRVDDASCHSVLNNLLVIKVNTKHI